MSDDGLFPSSIGQAFHEAADPEAARAVLERYLHEGMGLRALRIVKVWPRPDGVFVLLYEIEDDKGTAWTSLYLFPPGHDRTLKPLPARTSHVPEWNAYAQRFPNDYRMPHLRIAAVPRRARDIIAPVLKSSDSRWRGFCLRSIKPRSYWPSRKCLLKYKGSIGDSTPAHFYAKVFFDDTATKLLDLHKKLRAGGVEVPVLIGHCQEFKAALFAPAPGRMLFELLDSPTGELSLANAGRILGRFHQCSTDLQLPIHGYTEEIAVLEGWLRALESLGIQNKSKARGLLDRLKANSAAAGRPHFPGHGDFYDKQLLFDGKIITVLDLDMACRAPAERDAGNFLAHLKLRGLENGGRADRYSRLARAFTEAYEEDGGRLSGTALHWYCASTFLRLACRASLQPGEAGYHEPLVALAGREIELI